MITTLRVAWRNIWRNKRRTAITGTAVALNTAILIATVGLMDGMMLDTLRNTTQMSVGEAQVHARGYRKSGSLYDAISDVDGILEAARRNGIAAVPRSYGFGLLACKKKSAGAKLWGVHVAAERATLQLPSHIKSGSFLSPTAASASTLHEVVLGSQLATSLEARVGSEIVAVVQAADGSLGNELLQVVGILESVSTEIDGSAALIHAGEFEALFASAGRVHEIVLNSKGRLSSEGIVAAIEPAAGGMEVLSWQKLLPSLAEMLDLYDAVIWLFGFVFYLAAGMGVMNSMLMATFERMREFGIMKAIGATPWRIIRDVAAEAFMLALVASLVGLVLGALADLYLFLVGIDLATLSPGIKLSGVAMSTIWRASISMQGFVLPVVLMWLMCVIAALYPGIKAARLDPIRAMTHN